MMARRSASPGAMILEYMPGSFDGDRLLFLHISDLHFAGQSTPRGRLGRTPHRPELASALGTAYRSIKETYGLDRLRVVVSGDLSTGGEAGELDAALQFLSQREPPYPGDPELFGLGVDADDLFVITGNHDQWNNGVWPKTPGYNSALTARPEFATASSPRTWTEGDIELRLFAVDSASGFANGELNPLALGAIAVGEFKALQTELGKDAANPNLLRAVVCHHSLVYGAPEAAAAAYRDVVGTNQLDDTSREVLLQWALRHQVTAILTGHIHRTIPPFLHRRALVTGGPQRLTTEVVSQTTLQQPAGGAHGFWLHLIKRERSLHWSVQRWEWQGGFNEFRAAGDWEALTTPMR